MMSKDTFDQLPAAVRSYFEEEADDSQFAAGSEYSDPIYVFGLFEVLNNFNFLVFLLKNDFRF